MAQLAAITVGDMKVQMEEELARVRDTLAAAEEARHKAEDNSILLEVEQTSLLQDIRLTKDEVSSLQSQVGMDKEAMTEDTRRPWS